jgi:glycosyltransferase involved in cell wall biosynthesis
MRIGFDVRSLQGHDRFRGIGTYVSGLLSALARRDRDNQYTLFIWPADARHPVVAPELARRIVTLRKPLGSLVLDRTRNYLWRDIRVSGSDIDVFVQPNTAFGLPRGKIPMVAVAYDLIPLIFRDRYYPPYVSPSVLRTGTLRVVRNAAWAWSVRWQYEWQLHQLLAADHVIAISRATKDDLLRCFPRINPQAITIIPPACDPTFRPSPERVAGLARFGIKGPFLLYVGGLDFRKNVPALLAAYDRVREAGCEVQLVLAGSEFVGDDRRLEFVEIRERMEASKHRADIVRTGFIERADLVALYSGALAFVFPSLYEGFGLPALEAMACGCPVIAYRNSSIPEVVDAAGMLLDPREDLAAAIREVIGNEGLRRNLSAAGLVRAAQFSWDASAQAFLEVLRLVVEARIQTVADGRLRSA